MEPVYDSSGEVVGWRDANDIYDLDGAAAAFLGNQAVYSYQDGRVLGWLVDGHYCDLDGDAVAFESGAQGGPLKSLQQLRPLEPLRALTPLRPLRSLEPLRPLFSSDWSALTWKEWLEE